MITFWEFGIILVACGAFFMCGTFYGIIKSTKLIDKVNNK